MTSTFEIIKMLPIETIKDREELFALIDWHKPIILVQLDDDNTDLDLITLQLTKEAAADFAPQILAYLRNRYLTDAAVCTYGDSEQCLRMTLTGNQTFLFNAFLCGSGYSFYSENKHYLDIFDDMWNSRHNYAVLFALKDHEAPAQDDDPVQVDFDPDLRALLADADL